jgi:hypothetical protein
MTTVSAWRSAAGLARSRPLARLCLLGRGLCHLFPDTFATFRASARGHANSFPQRSAE